MGAYHHEIDVTTAAASALCARLQQVPSFAFFLASDCGYFWSGCPRCVSFGSKIDGDGVSVLLLLYGHGAWIIRLVGDKVSRNCTSIKVKMSMCRHCTKSLNAQEELLATSP